MYDKTKIDKRYDDIGSCCSVTCGESVGFFTRNYYYLLAIIKGILKTLYKCIEKLTHLPTLKLRTYLINKFTYVEETLILV